MAGKARERCQHPKMAADSPTSRRLRSTFDDFSLFAKNLKENPAFGKSRNESLSSTQPVRQLKRIRADHSSSNLGFSLKLLGLKQAARLRAALSKSSSCDVLRNSFEVSKLEKRQ